jgi:hypothetical protein
VSERLILFFFNIRNVKGGEEGEHTHEVANDTTNDSLLLGLKRRFPVFHSVEYYCCLLVFSCSIAAGIVFIGSVGLISVANGMPDSDKTTLVAMIAYLNCG